MSREQEFRNLIKGQKSEANDQLWQRIEEQQDERTVELGSVLAKRRLTKWQLALAVCVPFVVIVAIILSIWYFSSNSHKIRYCVNGEYYSTVTDVSVEQYGKDNNIDILYFDWYQSAYEYESKQLRLIDTEEVICLNEVLLDDYGNIINFYVTDNKTSIDFLESNKAICIDNSVINGVEINWFATLLKAKACFTYKNLNYYLDIELASQPEYVLELVENLLKSAKK